MGERARSIRSTLHGEDAQLNNASDLSYPKSSYSMKLDTSTLFSASVERGFCNWLIPGTLMVGQYPGKTPETNGPSQKECEMHLRTMVNHAGVSLFCCLQSEVP